MAADRCGFHAAAGGREQVFLPETIGQEPEVADTLEAGRQGVEEKAADELLGRDGQRFRLLLVMFAVVFPMERDLPVFEREQALIRDCDAVFAKQTPLLWLDVDARR